jgi:hypothetical protein
METTNLNWTTGQAIQDFYDRHDFGEDGGVNEKYAWIKFGFISIPIPNAESRRNNVYLHDVSHIVTGQDTTWKGESTVSAWEVASGGWDNLYLPWLLTLWAMGLGVLFYPSSVLKSFKQGLTMNNALTCGLSKNEIYELSVTDLRAFLSNKPKRNKNPYVWMMLSFLIFLLPFLIGLSIIFIIIKVV